MRVCGLFSMRRRKVLSSSIRSVGYDPGERVLDVQFEQGDVYRYFGVPPRVYEKLIHADSIGAYVNRGIKRDYDHEGL